MLVGNQVVELVGEGPIVRREVPASSMAPVGGDAVAGGYIGPN
jgi:hypothetical protein